MASAVLRLSEMCTCEDDRLYVRGGKIVYRRDGDFFAMSRIRMRCWIEERIDCAVTTSDGSLRSVKTPAYYVECLLAWPPRGLPEIPYARSRNGSTLRRKRSRRDRDT